MAVKKTKKAAAAAVVPEKVPVEVPKWRTGQENEEEKLDPQEEKVLDWILKGVVGFILAWLGLSVLMVIGGLFHLWG
jgi:hypothetical protein